MSKTVTPKPEHLFKKGKSGNPQGRPKLPPDLRAIRLLSAFEVKALISKIGRLPSASLLALSQDPNLTTVERTLANIWLKAMTKADYATLDFLLNRSVGKVKEEKRIEFSDQPDAEELSIDVIRAYVKAKTQEAMNVTPLEVKAIEQGPDSSPSTESLCSDKSRP